MKKRLKNFEKFGTAEERYGAFYEYCAKREAEKRCDSLCMRCQFEWLDLEAEEVKPLPCPFCGEETKIMEAWGGEHYVRCKSNSCCYSSGFRKSVERVIADHNLVAKAVMDAKKEV